MALKEGLPDPPYPPEAVPLNLKGVWTCTIGVTWTAQGLVDLIYLDHSSRSSLDKDPRPDAPDRSRSDTLDRAALRWAFTHWRVDPKNIIYPKDKDGKDKPFTKTVTFVPPGQAPAPPR